MSESAKHITAAQLLRWEAQAELQDNCSCADGGCSELKEIGHRILDGLVANRQPGGNAKAYWAAIDELQQHLGRYEDVR